MRWVFFLILFISFDIISFGQDVNFVPPLNIPLVLNGNFGELRSNHFHAGIDLKTKGETGLPVFAIEEGFVSRISVSATGYGNALYIEHPSGYTSVYGHLESFKPEIAEWVKQQQYKEKSFEVNLFPAKNQFKIEKGKEIAKSGNSGSSAGPHLHFELRKTDSENPVNPLFFKFDIQDKTKPVVENLYVYPIGEGSHVQGKTTPDVYKLVYYADGYHLKGFQSLNFYGEVGLGIDAIDYLDGNWSKCGIYQIDLWIDNKLINSFELDELNYDNMRCANSHMDYAQYVLNRSKIHKTFVEPGNKLQIYQQTLNNGIFNYSDGKRHKVQIMLYDAYMNVSQIEFYALSTQPVEHKKPENTTFFEYDRDNSLKTEEFEILIPKGALYTNIDFEFKKGNQPAGAYSSLFRCHKKTTPLQINSTIRIKTNKLPRELESKAIIALFDTKSGKFSSIGGTYSNEWVTTSTRFLGDVCVTVDTIAPTIQALSIKNNTLSEAGQIRFIINDDLSGIKEYKGLIDGKWVLFEYDAKRNLLQYSFDEHIKSNKTHKIQLTVEDNKNNVNTYEANFNY